MTATLIAEGTIAAAIPGLNAALILTGDALTTLHGAVDLNIGALGAVAGLDLQAEIDLNVGALNASIGAGFDAQISAGIDLSANLSAIVDAGAWLGNIVANLNASATLLAGLDADLKLAADIGGVDIGVNATIGLKADFDANLDMPDVQIALDAVANISAALDVAIKAAVPGIVAYVEITSLMLGAGVAIVHFSGDLTDFGTDCDAALAGSSLPTSNATGVALVVSSSNPTTEANFKLVFGIS